MKSVSIRIAFVITILALSVLISGVPTTAEATLQPPDCQNDSWRTVRLSCADGAVGSAAGTYGGTSFGVSCDGNIGTTQICAEGTSYGVRLGQNRPLGVDCFYSGDSVAVAKACGRLHLVIAGSPGGN